MQVFSSTDRGVQPLSRSKHDAYNNAIVLGDRYNNSVGDSGHAFMVWPRSLAEGEAPGPPPETHNRIARAQRQRALNATLFSMKVNDRSGLLPA